MPNANSGINYVLVSITCRPFERLKPRRQHPIPPYIVDFYRESRKLMVELDGSRNNEKVDRERALFLEDKGLTIVRYWDNEVLQQMEAVLEAIVAIVDSRTLTPTPLPTGEGL